MTPRPLSSTPDAPQPSDEELVTRAKSGEMRAMEWLIVRHQATVFNLSLRMIWRREAAEDATQEILLKAVTRLSTFEGRSQFSTWLYRIAVNHLLDVKKSEMEEKSMTFSDLAVEMDGLPDLDLPDERSLPVSHGLLLEEAKLGCVTAMLMCLDRRQRLAFILGEILGVASDAGGEAMGVSSENFRQLLTRARRDLYQFMQDKCGLVNTRNPCRCHKKAKAFSQNGWLDPADQQFTRNRIASVEEIAPSRLEELASIERAHAAIYRSAPFCAPREFTAKLRALLAESSISRDS
jgi:RNA polymerase sigma factor (sigma-70 family)